MRKYIRFALPIGLAFFFGCATPGHGEKAEHGYATLQPVIEALKRYKSDNGRYPNDLNELVPKYLSSFPREIDGFPMEYSPAYNLHFDYTGPGYNHCDYSPNIYWTCGGSY